MWMNGWELQREANIKKKNSQWKFTTVLHKWSGALRLIIHDLHSKWFPIWSGNLTCLVNWFCFWHLSCLFGFFSFPLLHVLLTEHWWSHTKRLGNRIPIPGACLEHCTNDNPVINGWPSFSNKHTAKPWGHHKSIVNSQTQDYRSTAPN